jgi:hypothetical protein
MLQRCHPAAGRVKVRSNFLPGKFGELLKLFSRKTIGVPHWRTP